MAITREIWAVIILGPGGLSASHLPLVECGFIMAAMCCLLCRAWSGKQSYNFVHRLPVANRYMHLSCLHCTKKLFLETTIESSVSLGIRPKFNIILDCTPPSPLPCELLSNWASFFGFVLWFEANTSAKHQIRMTYKYNQF